MYCRNHLDTLGKVYRRLFVCSSLQSLCIHILAAADQTFVHQRGQQFQICIFRLHQQVAIPVNGVISDVIRIPRRLGIVRMDACQLLHPLCQCFALLYI